MDHPPSDFSSPNSIVDDKSESSSNSHHPVRLIQPSSNSPEGYFANLARYTEADNTARQNDDLQCLVCGDRSNGKHYGVLTCNGCSGFFKRTVRRKLIYHCQGNSTMCLIDKIHRNQCQACRYKKCLQMGMIKEAVQNERPSRLKMSSSEQIENTLNIFSTSKQTKDQLVNHLDDTIATEILLIIIEWIRHLPIFFHLSIHDQHVLLEETWSDLFLLSALSMKNEHIFVNHGEIMENIWLNFQNFNIDAIELICLKAIVLFRFDLRRLKDNQLVENFQDQAQMTLAKYNQMSTRFGRLLISLSSLRAIPVRWIEQTYFSSRLISKDLVHMFSNTKK